MLNLAELGNQTDPNDAFDPTLAIDPPTPQELATRFPKLVIHRLVGQGGMGAVYEASQPALDRKIALKIMRPQFAVRTDFTERFHREARALAKLNHPNIVSIYDFGDSDGLCYFLMEYVEGCNLKQLMRKGRLETSQSLAIVSQICQALQFAHDHGIVHRDIKTDNVLINEKGEVKIVDFGLAKLAFQNRPTHLTQVDQVMGTPNYMAPEQAAGKPDVDHRADIYSLGVVFYEMLTGELPVGRFEVPSQKSLHRCPTRPSRLAFARQRSRTARSAGKRGAIGNASHHHTCATESN